jgi:hypothetical protein
MTPNLKGEIDFTTFRRELFGFNSVVVKTGTISSNSTEFFAIDESEDIVDSVNFTPSNRELPRFGRLLTITVNVVSGSTDTTLAIYEDESGAAIHQTTEITNLDVSGSPESFNLNGGIGQPFVNQQDESELYLEIGELSGNDAEYEVKVTWANTNTPQTQIGAL